MLVIHVGYAKTGTTFLQRKLFPFLPNANFMGRTYHEDGTQKENLADLVAAVNGATNVDKNYVRGSLLANMRDGLNIISQEALMVAYQTEHAAARLAHLTRGLQRRILITIRRQEAMIWSRYVHDRARTKSIIPAYNLGQALAAEGECAWPHCRSYASDFACGCKAAKAKIIPLNFFDYHRIFSIYAEHFGAENVYVLPLEYTAEQSRYFGHLENVLGIDIPEDIRASVDTSERVNRGAVMPELEPDKARLPWLGVHRLFAASNIMLNDRLGLDLDRFGYFRSDNAEIAAKSAVAILRNPAPQPSKEREGHSPASHTGHRHERRALS